MNKTLALFIIMLLVSIVAVANCDDLLVEGNIRMATGEAMFNRVAGGSASYSGTHSARTYISHLTRAEILQAYGWSGLPIQDWQGVTCILVKEGTVTIPVVLLVDTIKVQGVEITPDLPGRVAALEARIAALEAQLAKARPERSSRRGRTR